MQIFLHVEKGPHVGRRVAIRSGQVASFGKTEQADHCFEQDLELSDQHFRIRVADSCTIELLDGGSELLVNGGEVDNPLLSNGDIISAGLSVFRVEIEGAIDMDSFPDANIPEPNSDTKAEPVDLLQLCVDLDLGEEATAEATKHQSEEELLSALKSENWFNDAIRLHVHLLSPTDAILWAANSIRYLLDGALKPGDSDAIQKASDWAENPSESSRRECGRTAESLDYEGTGGTLALAAFLSGGNIAPEEFEEEVQPEPFSFGQAAAGAVLLAISEIDLPEEADPDESDEKIKSILERSS